MDMFRLINYSNAKKNNTSSLLWRIDNLYNVVSSVFKATLPQLVMLDFSSISLMLNGVLKLFVNFEPNTKI